MYCFYLIKRFLSLLQFNQKAIFQWWRHVPCINIPKVLLLDVHFILFSKNTSVCYIFRKDKLKPIKSHKIFTNLTVEDLSFDSINQQTSPSSRMIINENLVLNDSITVLSAITSKSGLINNYSLKNEIVQIGEDQVYDSKEIPEMILSQ